MPINNAIQRFRAFLARNLLVILGNRVVQKAKGKASWSKSIPDAIGLGAVRLDGPDIYSISIDVDLEKAPQARAFEFGSGIHATQGQKGKYSIDPVKATALVFHWENEPVGVKNFPHTADGRIILRHVEHPGVAPRPYLAPAIKEEMNFMVRTIMNLIGDVSMDAVTISFTEAEAL